MKCGFQSVVLSKVKHNMLLRTNAPLLMNAYQTPFHRTTFVIYKFNIKVTIKKRRPMKKGRNYSHIIVIKLMWVHKSIPHSTSMESLTC